MKIAILQSNYIPWKGYFDLIHDVDTFIFYDDVQYTKNDWRNRNTIKTANGLQWLSIPTGTNIKRRICDVQIEDPHWKTKHWHAICHNYSKTLWFNHYRTFFEEFYLNSQLKRLSEINQFLIKHIAQTFLGCKTVFYDSSDFPSQEDRQNRLISLIKLFHGTTYISGPSGRSYLSSDLFTKNGITLAYKTYDHYPTYPQQHPPFEHCVSILDLLFNCGPNSPEMIWGNTTHD